MSNTSQKKKKNVSKKVDPKNKNKVIKNKKKADKIEKPTKEESEKDKIKELEKDIEINLKELEAIRGRKCYPLLDVTINSDLVDYVFDELRQTLDESDGKLDVIINSSGGDIDAAYNLAELLRKIGYEELTFIVPRWAKSAATLVVCSGDEILMNPVSELGPLDPQITQFSPFERRFEHFSPLHLEPTLEIIREEFEKGSSELAQALVEKLQYPLTLGGIKKFMEIGEQYLAKLLKSRMLKDENSENIEGIAQHLTKGYADHGHCININEADSLGLIIKELEGKERDITWEIYKFNKEKSIIEKVLREKDIANKLKNLPPDVLKNLPPDMFGNLPNSDQK